jgi:hypothetical protein
MRQAVAKDQEREQPPAEGDAAVEQQPRDAANHDDRDRERDELAGGQRHASFIGEIEERPEGSGR